jgi:hypothetical protein
MLAGCMSLPGRYPAKYPARQEQPGTNISQDEAQCASYAQQQSKDRGEHYQACMVSRFYAVTIGMDESDWSLGVAQTRPHDPAQVKRDMWECDQLADNIKSTDRVALTPEQARGLDLMTPVPGSFGIAAQRPNAARMLVACLSERGYKVVPRVGY